MAAKGATHQSKLVAQSTQPQHPKHSQRPSRVACSFCHMRRIRCDALELQPCSNCVAANQSCQLIDSKRGRYHRGRTLLSSGARSSAKAALSVSQRQLCPIPENATAFTAPRPLLDDTIVVDSTSPVNIPTEATRDYFASGVDTESDNTDNAHRPGKELTHTNEGSENLYARLSELRASTLGARNLLGVQTVYLGESFLLRWVVQDALAVECVSAASGSPPSLSTTSILQVPVPSGLSDKANNLGYETKLDPEDIEVLKIRGAFNLPETTVSDLLVGTFFECFYPAFPIFDRKEFAQLYKSGQMSLLVLNAIYLVASTLCDDDVIRRAGFENRNIARKIFLKRAGALYEADWETNKVALVQATFIISFLWNGPTDEKDMWHWLGIATSIAQAKGMHRSTRNSPLQLRDRRLWKRIWWSLYVRDRHCAANMGRPLRICEDDCDVEPLEESDFEDDFDYAPGDASSIYGQTIYTHVVYAMSMCRLSNIFGRIVTSKFPISDSRVASSRDQLDSELRRWRQQLPSGFWDQGDNKGQALWSRMLDFSYNHMLIILHRPEQSALMEESQTALSQEIAFDAAHKVTRIIDDLLIGGAMRRTQLQVCPSIFASLAMYVVLSRNADPMQRKLAENKASLLMLGLGEIAKTWPAATWILRLFEAVFRKQQEKNQWTSLQGTSMQNNTLLPQPLSANVPSEQPTGRKSGTSMCASNPHAGLPLPHDLTDQSSLRIGDVSARGGPDFQGGPETVPAFSLQDLFDADLFAEYPPDISFGTQEFAPYLMEFNSFPEG